MDFAIAIPALVGAGAALITSAGEKLVGRFFDKSAKRESLRDADLQVLERIVFEVRDLATGYWASSPKPESEAVVEASILGRITFASGLVHGIFCSKIDLLQNLHVVTNRFDVACTSGDFGVRSRLAEPGRCREIEIAAYTLVHQANSLRRKL